jgi:hypothetical protein
LFNTPASAHIRPQLVAPRTSSSCTVGWNTNNSNRFTVWRTRQVCGESDRSHIKCESRGSFHNFDGVWKYNLDDHSSASCPSGWLLYCGAAQQATPTGPVSTTWIWPNSDCDTSQPVATTAFVRGLAACGFSSPAYDYNDNITGSSPPPWGAVWWPTGAERCGLWVSAVGDFSTGNPVYGPHRTSYNDISKVTGPLNDSLTRLYEQVGSTTSSFRCIRRVFHTANNWACSGKLRLRYLGHGRWVAVRAS